LRLPADTTHIAPGGGVPVWARTVVEKITKLSNWMTTARTFDALARSNESNIKTTLCQP